MSYSGQCRKSRQIVLLVRTVCQNYLDTATFLCTCRWIACRQRLTEIVTDRHDAKAPLSSLPPSQTMHPEVSSHKEMFQQSNKSHQSASHTWRGASIASVDPRTSLPTPYVEPPRPPDFYESFLERIDDQRWELRDARENLHGDRARLRARRRALQAARDTAAIQAAKAFDLLKRYLLEQNVETPQNIQSALDVADTLRDRLGEDEVDYEQAEDLYNMKEWEYTETEKNFVDDVYAHESLDSVPANDEGLTQFALGASEDPNAYPWEVMGSSRPTTVDNVDLEEPKDSLIHDRAASVVSTMSDSSPIVMSDTSLEGEMLDTMHDHPARDNQLSAKLSFSSIPVGNSSAPFTTPGLTRPYSESDLAPVRLHWSDTRKRIEQWLLDALKGSHIQQAQLRNWLSGDTLEFKEWWAKVERYWNSDSPTSMVFHTGDTVASPLGPSHKSSTGNRNNGPAEASVSDHELKTSIASPLALLDRVVYAEDSTSPLAIGSSDLGEPSSLSGTSILPHSRSYSPPSFPAAREERENGFETLSTPTQRNEAIRTSSGNESPDRQDHKHDIHESTRTNGREAPMIPMTEDRKTNNCLFGPADANTDTPSAFIQDRLPEHAGSSEHPVKDSNLLPASEIDQLASPPKTSKSSLAHEASTMALDQKDSQCIVQ
jgi:hypothetical protein